MNGSVTCTYRYWKRLQAKPGNFYKINPIGHIKVSKVIELDFDNIRQKDARASGFDSIENLRDYLVPFAGEDRVLYRIDFTYEGHRPDQEPDKSAISSTVDIDAITKKLAVRDRNSGTPWTQKTLKLVAANPGMSSAFLAEKLDRDRAGLKRDMVKLKQLGLTISLEVGYKLSPKGQSYLKQVK